MTRQARDPWNLPAIGRFGAQLRDLQSESPHETALEGSRLSRRALLITSGGVAAPVICVILLLAGRTAQARNAVNEAPAAAERSRSVQFRSVLAITVDGHPRPGIIEHGAIDFANGTYTTTIRLGSTSQLLERRSVNGVLYSAQRQVASRRATRTRWDATPLNSDGRGLLASESDAFTDPPSVFRALAHISSPVRRLGHQTLEGVPTIHYHLLTNLAAFLSLTAGHIQNPVVYRLVQATLDVWLDARGRPRRVQENFSGPSSAGRTVMRTTVRFTNYERPVSMQPPARSLVRVTKGATSPNPLAAGPGPLLARLLFFAPAVTSQRSAPPRYRSTAPSTQR